MCHFVLVFFSPFSIAITSLGEERANLSAFRTFVRFVLVWICRFPLPLGVWEGLRFVIVAFPGLFSYLFWICHSDMYLRGFGRHFLGLNLPVAGLAAWDTLLADTRDCRGAWPMLAEVARWGTLFNRSVGVSYLMSAVGLSHDLRRLMCAWRGMCFTCGVLPNMIFGYKVLGLCATKFGAVTLILLLFDS